MIHLDSEQKKVVCHWKGPLLVAAGPGSGKTRVLTERIAWLIQRGVSHKNILAVTFTNKAALEMENRIMKRINSGHEKAKLPFIGTIHALCLDILSHELKEEFFIIDDFEQEEIIRKIKQKNKKIKKTAKELLSIISRAKSISSSVLPDDEHEVYKLYENELKSLHALDYDDLIKKTLMLLSSKKEITLKYQKRYHHVLIDEYQDINFLQSKILYHLAKPQNNLFAIGDIDQSIYRFRGAELKIFLSFQKTYPNSKVVYLYRNYRSTKHIAESASMVIRNNNKRLSLNSTSMLSKGHPIRIVSCQTSRDEAKYIASEIEKRIGGTSFLAYDTESNLEQENIQFGDIAVLYRKHSFAQYLEGECIHRGIPYQIIGKSVFWHQPEIYKIMLFLKSLINPSYRKHPLIASRSIDFNLLSKSNLKAGNMKKVLNESGFLREYQKDEQALNNIEILYSFINETAKTDLKEILSHLSLASRETYLDKRAHCVRLMTIHASKGLEFDTVFIAGAEEGFIPSLKENSQEEIEDERRLLYVAMTRARKQLYITHVRKRIIWGKKEQRTPSRFIFEINSDNVKGIEFHKKKKQKDQMKLC